jgi:hypothetical protein
VTPAINLSPVPTTPAIINRRQQRHRPVTTTLAKDTLEMKQLQQNQLAYTSTCTSSKNSLHECKQQPNNISKKYEKLSISKILSFIAGFDR